MNKNILEYLENPGIRSQEKTKSFISKFKKNANKVYLVFSNYIKLIIKGKNMFK